MNQISSDLVSISIIIPAYNVQNFIGEAIQSLISQSFQSWELLVCDDASTDNTLKVIKSFDDPRIKVFENKINQGPGRTRDLLIQQASGQWVAVLDSDDVYEPTRLEVFYEVAQKYPNAIIFDEIMECHDTERGLIPWRTVRDPSLLMGKTDFSDDLGREVSIVEWLECERIMMQWMAPADLIKKHDVTHLDIRFGEDLGFIFRLLSATNSPLWYIPQPLYLYRLSSGSLTTSSGRFDNILSVFNDAKKYSGFDGSVVSAIDSRAKKIERRIIYQRFLSALVRYKIVDAVNQAVRHPWVISEFIWRVFERIPYHLHRKYHNGSRRETT